LSLFRLGLLPEFVHLSQIQYPPGERPWPAARASIRRKRRSKRRTADRRAPSASMPSFRARLTTAKRRSPSSRRAASRSPWARAWSSSWSSSRTLALGPALSSQSKPTRAARRWMASARARAGRWMGMPSMREASASSEAWRSRSLMACQAVSTSRAFSTVASPKTWGWRRISFSVRVRAMVSRS